MENIRIDPKHINRPHGDNIFINPLYVYEEHLRLIYFPDESTEKMRQGYLDAVNAVLAQIDQPAKVVVAGGFNAGKSTFINALLNREIMPMGPIRTTATVNHLLSGARQEFVIFRKNCASLTKPYLDDAELASAVCTLMNEEHDNIQHIEIFCPDQTFLDKFTLIDTPGLDFSEQDTAATLCCVEQADAIIWLLHPEGLRDQDLKPIAQFHKVNPASPLIVVINQIDTLDNKSDRDCVFKTVSEKLKDITQHIFLLSAKKALVGQKHEDSSELKNSGFHELSHYLYNHLFNAYRDLLEQRIKQHIKQRSDNLIQAIDYFLKENTNAIVTRIPARPQDIKNALVIMKQKENDLHKRIKSLEKKLSALQSEIRSIEETNTILVDGLAIPSMEHLMAYLPALFNNFWGVVRPDEFASRVGLSAPPSIPSPYIYPNAERLVELQIKYQELPIMDQLRIISFCRLLMDNYNLELRSGMQILHNENQNNI